MHIRFMSALSLGGYLRTLYTISILDDTFALVLFTLSLMLCFFNPFSPLQPVV